MTDIPAIDQKITLFDNALHQEEQQQLYYKKQSKRLSLIRLLYFLGTLISIVYFANNRAMYAVFIVAIPAPFLFGLIINRHNKIKLQLNLAANKVLLYQQEINRLKLNLDGLEGGKRFLTPEHPYAHDLDVFGDHSLFSLINRSHTPTGQQTLANWLAYRSDPEAITTRQEAIKELRSDWQWRSQWQALGMHQEEEADRKLDILLKWFKTDRLESLNSKKHILLPWLGRFLLLGSALLALFGIIPWSLALLPLILNGIILGSIQNQMNDMHKHTAAAAKILKSHEGLLKMAEEREVESAMLKRIKEQLVNPSAAKSTRKLYKILDWLNARGGIMYWVINPFVLIDHFTFVNLHQWKNAYGNKVEPWFNALGMYEALNSLASFSFAHEQYTNASIDTELKGLVGKEIGHPLIPHHQRVNNDFAMEKIGSVVLITGANMSGKSTFERALGINLILAQTGAACCAGTFRCGPLQVFTSMRTQDNLKENTSSFYAELKRLKQLVTITSNPQEVPTFYLLDEILKGTNSEDRHIGAESLIRQLMKTNSLGLVSTHDLGLANLESQLEQFKNHSFNSTVEGDEVLFDYKLHDGVCHTFNAVPLMRKMGISITE